MTRIRRVVLIAYFFPPTGGVSVARMLRTSEYLPRYGWEPIVIAPMSSGHSIQDPAGLTAIRSDLRVIRTRCPEPAKAKNLIRARINRQPMTVEDPPGLRPDSSSPTTWPHRVGARLSVLAHQFLFPDDQIAWLPFAVGAAVEAARKGGAHAILSTSSPATAHLIAMVTSRLVGIPWVADFRDPWVGNALDRNVPRVIAAMRRTLEQRFVASATELTFVTPSLMRMYAERYPVAAPRMHTVPNGYDRREPVARAAHDPGAFTLVWAGSLNRPLELEVFLAGLQSLITAAPDLSERLRVRFVGSVDAACAALLDRAAGSAELGSTIDVVGSVPRDVALGIVQSSDAALLLLPGGPGSEINASGKLYDYIGRDRQVLAVVPEGDAAEVLRQLDWGVIVPPTIDGVARGLREVMATPPKRAVADPDGRFDWANLTSRFAAALDRAVTFQTARSSVGGRNSADEAP